MDPLLEKAHALIQQAGFLSVRYPAGSLPGLRDLLRAMNSYYSHQLENQHAPPLEIEQALQQNFSASADKSRRQRLALAHMATESQMQALWPQWSPQTIWSAQMVRDIHQDLFARLPEADRIDPKTRQILQPGAWRSRAGQGRNPAPTARQIGVHLAQWAQGYGHVRRGELQVVAMAAAHHRLNWIQPFPDGNGRVARLHTHLVLGHLGLTNGLWSPLRGFARTREAYGAHLAAADAPRSKARDGRGPLSEQALVQWIDYALGQCLEQVQFITQLLDGEGMKDRIAACLAYEQQVVKQGVRSEALRALHYLFATQAELDRADFKALLGLGDRLATAQITALLQRGLLQTDSPYGRVRLGVPQHALRFYFPKLWPEAEGGAG
ncbi:MAG: Fic family protein [Burkholderiaceae bacterium]|nr:Fic family protein [Burkholderiaceae bacterium]